MDRHASHAIRSLQFLDALFPEDDATRVDLKKDLKAAIQRCTDLVEEARVEEEKAAADAKTKDVSLKQVMNTLLPVAPTEIEEFKEELSEAKKEQLLKEAIIARDQLRAVMDEVEAHLKVLQPSDKVEIVRGEVVVTSEKKED